MFDISTIWNKKLRGGAVYGNSLFFKNHLIRISNTKSQKNYDKL